MTHRARIKPSRALTVVLVIAICAPLAACGGGGSNRLSASQYRARLSALSGREQTAQAKIGAVMHAKSVGDIRTGLLAFAADQQAAGDEVAALKAPKNAAAANAELARGFHDDATETRAIASRLAGVKSSKAAIALLGKAQPRGGTEIDSALATLKKEGYAHGG
jgi:hypothetical protein